MRVQVKANNDFNKSFGIESGKVYSAERVETKIEEPTIYKNKPGYFIAVSYTVETNMGELNFDAQDFSEI